MQEDDFRIWLINEYRTRRGQPLDTRTVGFRISNCKTVEEYEGDLDSHWDNDQLELLIQKLTYSVSDERSNKRPIHAIPIDGDIRNGSGTLKSAVCLYQQFRNQNYHGRETLLHRGNRNNIRTNTVGARPSVNDWPQWSQPSQENILALAHLSVPFFKFLDPEIVKAIADDNRRQRTNWIKLLADHKVDPSVYLWIDSPCAFPGIRRYAGSKEIAIYRGHALHDETQSLNALALDDNDYPKQIWSFIFRGKQFSKFGPDGYSLAHLADHKVHGNRSGHEFELVGSSDLLKPLYGLYTCPSNTVYVPSNLIKPTDFVGTMRALLIRRAQHLYGTICSIVPPFLSIPKIASPEWDIREFKWGDPVGATENVPEFLAFREKRMRKLFENPSN